MAGFQGAVYLVVTPSARARRVAFCAHLAAAALLVAGIPTGIAVLVVLTLLVGNAWRIDRQLAGAADAVDGLVLAQADRWTVHLRDGRRLSARSARRPYVSLPLMALSLRCADHRTRHVLLLADNSDATQRRRLRVRLLARVQPR